MRKVVEFNIVGESKKNIAFMIAGAVIMLIIVIVILVAVKTRKKDSDDKDVRQNVEEAVDVVEDVAHEVIVGQEGEVNTESRISLKDVVEINRLQTFSYTYNSTCAINEEGVDSVGFYTAYEGLVTFSIDTNDIDIETDDEAKIIHLTVPELEKEYSIDAGTLDYIFIDADFEKDKSVPTMAYKLAIEDLKKKAENNEYMLSLARMNTEHELEALITPIVDQMFDREYSVDIRWRSEA